MEAPVLRTKFFIPPSRSEVVSRPRLFTLLNQGLDKRITTVCAPAGFGKSTLVSAWTQSVKPRVAWLSLDSADNDLTRFWTYVISALQTIDSSIGDVALAAVTRAQEGEILNIVSGFINDLVENSSEMILVLDDYHHVDSSTVNDSFLFFVENTPTNLHLVLLSRSDPAWPLAKFRARNQLAEIRAQDLRFTESETDAFL
ncbi:MAG: LuxR family transcriptional regulator, partial [Chloroflexota bacterium]